MHTPKTKKRYIALTWQERQQRKAGRLALWRNQAAPPGKFLAMLKSHLAEPTPANAAGENRP